MKSRHVSMYTRTIAVWTLILSLALPLPAAGPAFARSTDDGASHVHARLNSPERAEAMAEAARKDAEMRASGAGEAAPPHDTGSRRRSIRQT